MKRALPWVLFLAAATLVIVAVASGNSSKAALAATQQELQSCTAGQDALRAQVRTLSDLLANARREADATKVELAEAKERLAAIAVQARSLGASDATPAGGADAAGHDDDGHDDDEHPDEPGGQ